MLKRFAPLLVIAFVTGFLFRMGNQFEIPVLRMFGTWGIVAIGIWGGRILRAIQREDGIRRVEESLEALKPEVRAERVAAVGALPVWMLETEKGKILLGTSDVANGARPARAERTLTRDALAMLGEARRLGLVGGGEPCSAALVLLRKAVRGTTRLEFDGGSVALVNPEGLSGLVGSRAGRSAAR